MTERTTRYELSEDERTWIEDEERADRLHRRRLAVWWRHEQDRERGDGAQEAERPMNCFWWHRCRIEYANHCLVPYAEADRLLRLNEGWELDAEREDYNVLGGLAQMVYLRQAVRR